MSISKWTPAPTEQISKAGRTPTASFGYLRPASQNAAATITTIAAVPTRECVAVRWPCRNALGAAQPGDPIHVGNQAGDQQHRRRHARDFVQSGASEGDRSECVGYGFHEKEFASSIGTNGRSRVPTPCEYYTGFGHGEGERVGHDAKFGGKAPGRLAVHLNQDGRGIDCDRTEGK